MLLRQNTIVVIVTFNPDLNLLQKSISRLISQFDSILIIDNNSSCDFSSTINKYQQVILLRNECNIGLSKALNMGFDYAKQSRFKYVLTLDQDSIIPTNLLNEYSHSIETNPSALITPAIFDRLLGDTLKEQNQSFMTSTVIISGLLTSVHLWDILGGFDENLFIDGIDQEFVIRAIKRGTKIVYLRDVVLSHEIGNGKKVQFLWHKTSVFNHSAFRKYHIAYSISYIAKKHGVLKDRIKARFRVFKQIALVLLFEDNKYGKVISLVRGGIDGRKS